VYGQDSTWAEALDVVADSFRNTIKQYSQDVLIINASGQLLTGDYYVANKLMKGFIGSANINTTSHLCMSSSNSGHKRAFDAHIIPSCYRRLRTGQ